MKHTILMVDDDLDNLITTREFIKRWGYQVETASSGMEAIAKLRVAPDRYSVALLDYQMPQMTGAEVAKIAREESPNTILITYSCDPSREAVLESFRSGGIDFIEKQEPVEVLRVAIERACERFEANRVIITPTLVSEKEELIASVGMVGRSDALAKVATQIKRFRDLKSPVLILGETGTGKELVAKALRSQDPHAPYISVNCAGISNANLSSTELFGYEKGAFTGADKRRMGLVEAAKGGVLFLDEVHLLTLDAQAQLLRALQEMKVRRVGSTEEYSVDFRLIAAGKADLEERVKSGTFLLDLYYRINPLQIKIPPLRTRPEDLEPLVRMICEKQEPQIKKKKSFQVQALKLLETYSWPGNVRELEGVVISLLAATDRKTIEPKDLDERFVEKVDPISSAEDLEALETAYMKTKRGIIEETLKSSRTVKHAADKLKVKVNTLHHWIKELGIQPVLEDRV